MTEAFKSWREAQLAHFEAYANKTLPLPTGANNPYLVEAMRYALLGGGKRIRALLAYAAGLAAQAKPATLDRVAMALECIHAYSLVHDDLPSMDNDDLRRGKPTVHKAYGEACGVLAGDALQTHAFYVLSQPSESAEMSLRLMHTLAHAAGHHGMCEGQMMDILMVHGAPSRLELEHMQSLKTGALMLASVLMGAQAGYWDQCHEHTRLAFTSFGMSLGVLFQITDDILDCTQETAVLGKTAGKDAKDDKPTWVSLLGLDGAREEAKRQYQTAIDALETLLEDEFIQEEGVHYLRAIADLVMVRTN